MSRRGRSRAARGVVAFGVMMLATTAGDELSLVGHAAAQEVAKVTSYKIPAGSLGQALTAFGKQAGLQVTFLASAATGKTSPGFSGQASREEALNAILSGTGLSYSFPNATTVAISAPANDSGATVEGAIALDTIDVSGAGGEAASADAPYQTPGSSAYISREQIERVPGTSSGDIFKATSGVIAAMNHNGSSIDVNIRGMQGMNRVKVTIDGTQQTTSTWRGYLGADDRTYVDPDFLGGVSIDKGPSGGAEGAGTNGGVVSFRTIDAQDIIQPGKTEGVRIRMGTSDNATSDVRIDSFIQSTDTPDLLDFENKSGSAAFAATRENFDIVVGIAKRKSGNYFAGTEGPTKWPSPLQARSLSYTKPGEEVFNSSEDTFSALAKTTLRFDNNQTLQLGYQRYESDFGETIGSLLTTQDTTYRQLPLANATVDTYTSRYRWDPASELVDVRLNAWATDVKATTISVGPYLYFPPFLTPETRPPAHDTRFSETWTYGTDITNTSRLATAAGAFKFDYGGSYVLEDTRGKPYISGRVYADSNTGAVPLNPAIGTRAIWSGFVDSQWEPTDWLKFNAGLRYDGFSIDERGKPYVVGNYVAVYADKSGGRLNPRASVTLTPLEGLQFYAEYEEGFRPPSLRETIAGDSGLAPNPLLDPETSKNWEFGANFLKNGLMTASDKARLKLSYFINNHDNYISRVQNPNPANGAPFFSVANLAKAKFTGVEFSGSYDMGYFFAETAITYYTGFEFCRTAATCGSAPIENDYALNQLPPELWKSLTLGVRLFDEKLTVGGRVIAAGSRLGPLPTAPQQTNFWVPYTVYDAFASYKANDNLTFTLNAENLFDRYYIDALDGWMPSPGRTIRTGLTLQF